WSLAGAPCLILAMVAGFLAREWIMPLRGEDNSASRREGHRLSPDTAAAYDPNWDKSYPQYQPIGKVLQPYPELKPGDMAPQDLSGFGGGGKSRASLDDVTDFADFYRKCAEKK